MATFGMQDAQADLVWGTLAIAESRAAARALIEAADSSDIRLSTKSPSLYSIIIYASVWLQMAAIGVQDVNAASEWDALLPAGSSKVESTATAKLRAAVLAPAPAVSGLKGLTEKLLGPAKTTNVSLPAAVREVQMTLGIP